MPDRELFGLPLPCSRVDLKAGYAVIRDPGDADQVLLTPTRRVTGIEDPYLLEAGAPNYWQEAWQARDLLARRIGTSVPREAVGMAVNAVLGRSQEQLHIHVSCIRPDVAALLMAAAPGLGDQWSSQMVLGDAWRARSVPGEDLGENNPFRLYADAEGAGGEMSKVTLVVVAARLSGGAPGFVLLSRMADPSTGFKGHGESLLDETCRSAAAQQPVGQ